MTAKKIYRILLFIFATFALVREIPALSAMATSVLAGSGVIALVIGFASQEALTNIVSGAFILFFRPFTLHDRIVLPDKNITGFVEDISLRHTVIRTIQNSRVIIPNSIINGAILENSNYKDNRRQNFFEINVSYTTDLNLALAIIEEEIYNHPYFLDQRTLLEQEQGIKPVTARVTGLETYSMKLRAGAWTEDFGKGYVMVCDLNKSIKERFDREGIEIPYPYQNVLVKSEGIRQLDPESLEKHQAKEQIK